MRRIFIELLVTDNIDFDVTILKWRIFANSLFRCFIVLFFIVIISCKWQIITTKSLGPHLSCVDKFRHHVKLQSSRLAFWHGVIIIFIHLLTRDCSFTCWNTEIPQLQKLSTVILLFCVVCDFLSCFWFIFYILLFHIVTEILQYILDWMLCCHRWGTLIPALCSALLCRLSVGSPVQEKAIHGSRSALTR
jgi:hypothetical protein